MKKSFLFYIFIFIIIALNTLAYNTIDMDYWARLLQGNAFWELGHILKTDPFSYVQTHEWIDHEWGSSVIFSFVQNTAGFGGILLLRTVIVFLIFFLIFKTLNIVSENRNRLLDVLLFGVSLAAMPTIIQSGLRCHFFTFLFFAFFIFILENVRKTGNRKLLLLLPVTMLFWCNIHGGCVSGLGLLGIYTIGEFLNKKPFKAYLLTLICSLIVLFINPYGFEYVKFIFIASTMERPFVTEWISPFFHPNWKFLLEFKILYIFYLLVLLFSFKKFKKDYTKYILLFVCAYVSFRYVKNVPFFIIVSFIFLYENIYNLFNKLFGGKVKRNAAFAIFVCIIILLLNSALRSFIGNIGYSFLREQPLLEVEFLKVNELKGKVLAPFDMGSYIAYKLYPDNLIYMDGRYEEVYYKDTKDALDDFYNVRGNWDKVLDGRPDYIIVPSDALLNDYLLENEDYKRIYLNRKNSVYSLKTNLKEIYRLPSENYYYYINNAFKTNFKYTDDIIIDGKKVIFE